MIRRLVLISVTILFALLAVLPALAGGWATITLDKLPTGILAGEPTHLEFMVRQHGVTPLGGLTPVLHFINAETGESFSINAVEENVQGHYAADFTLSSPGTWQWSIDAFTMSQPMPDLQAAGSAMQSDTKGFDFQPLSLAAGIAGLAVAGTALVIVFSRRIRWAAVFVLLGLLISGVGFYSASARPAATGQNDTDASAPTLAEQGEALFVAKGCLSCHANRRIEQRFQVFSTEMGPDLTNYQADFKTSPEFLRIWLSDPKTIRPNTQMPNLKLFETEIEALVAFLIAPVAQE